MYYTGSSRFRLRLRAVTRSSGVRTIFIRLRLGRGHRPSGYWLGPHLPRPGSQFHTQGSGSPSPGATAPSLGGRLTDPRHGSQFDIQHRHRPFGWTCPPRARALVPRPGSPGPSPEARGPASGPMQRVPGSPGSQAEAPGARSEVSAPERPVPTASPPQEASDDSRPASSSPAWLSEWPPTASAAGDGSLPRRAAWGGMASGTLLEAGLARVLFYPTLLYTLFRGKVPGPAHRDWYHRIDRTVLLGALPLRSMTRGLVEDENVRGVITMNEEYETRFLCNSAKEWRQVGVEQLRLSTVDMTGIPTLANLRKGVQFALKYQSLGQSVYVHCKAGRSRSATMVAAYLIQVHNWSPEEAIGAITKIRSHIHVRPGQLEILKEFHKEITASAAKDETHPTSQT
ncbi:phosphatidylglycerophosphatase and protein-tyrosine phosphatase 1 isoform X2 [Phyllostomus hastatus]|uniref:phosphatidylglycerophosphatase and protein-tyrosine phosphatase 1 isoform X2 n=1 Tax=Phyllostomus hastatus TaxID=9423 RepID=UPI001E681F65|nr:phosphatidylglycerophosphatase and protein-tyrosine phosphatase 1 isoform X2 [Phyllostomus hastatus]